MNVLITGGAGFVGRNMIRHIRRTMPDADILVVDTLAEDAQSFYAQGLDAETELVIEDVRDFVGHECGPFDLCIHLAAVVGGRQKIEGEPLAVAEDLAIDAAVIRAVHAGLANELMYFSSSAVYPVKYQTRQAGRRLAEDIVDPRDVAGTPDLTYGWAKLTGEFLCTFLDKTKVTIFRPFSGYGSDQLPSYPFPAICRRVLGGEDPLVVWGSGEQTRDFIHIGDACRMAFELHTRHPGGPYNLGTGVATSFVNLARTALSVLGREAKIVTDPAKPEGVFARVADTSRTDAAGVRAQTGLRSGIEQWFGEN